MRSTPTRGSDSTCSTSLIHSTDSTYETHVTHSTHATEPDLNPMSVRIQIRRLPSSNGLPLPGYMTGGAAGMDLHAAVREDLVIAPWTTVLVPTGLEIAIPEGFEGQIRPRSGLAVKHGITLPNTPATIDADYRGEIRVPLINLSQAAFPVGRGMRVAQLVVAPVVHVEWEEVDQLPLTVRGASGFGHSGL